MAEVDTSILDFCRQAIASERMFAVGTDVVDGVEYPIFANAPPTLGAMYQMAAANFGALDFIVYRDERTTYAEADLASRKAAAGLAAIGIKAGDPVAIAMRNYPEWLIAYMAITRMGAVAVPMNGWWTTTELDYACADSKARVVIADPQRAERLLPVADKHGLTIVCARGDVAGTQPWQTLLEVPQPLDSVAGAPDALGTIFYTSGSTGNPKGVMTTHRATITALMQWGLLTIADRTVRGVGPAEGAQMGILMTVPLFHVTGCNAMFLLSMLAGQKVVLMDRWNAEHAINLIAAERITAFNGVPSMSFELAQVAAQSGADLSSLYAISGGGAARPAAHVPVIEQAFENVMPSVGYGLTESSALGTANAGVNYQNKPNSVGQACFPSVELRIVDDQGNDCASGEPGEIWLKSAANMRGYLNKPDATADVLKDGFLATGDVGYVDDDGYVFIVDRIKDIVIRGGENISCQEVENALYGHAAVNEAAVFGLPDEKLGEQLVAVVSVSDTTVDEAALQDYMKDQVAYYKVPVKIDITAEPLPRTATAKIYKRGLREAALAAMTSG
ncbi:MAG: class I adenylate-forming enzyme family protein [Pseudomonadota bacterium]